jgi:hypothetical protein
MAMDHNPSSRRPHYHRGRRGTERRGNERRSQQAPEQSARPAGDQTDVEQIMREIRSRISQRHGVELSPQQIQDLAGRRLEAILDPRTVNPTLFDQLRKGAAAPPDPLPRNADTEYSITDDAIYEGGAVLRFFRRLLNPLMKLLFNPAPLVAALQAQTRINRDAAARAAELERRQTEWNALHYQILQRLVTEVSRTSIEMQSLGTRIESLAARVDFNDRRVRTLENAPTATRSQRPQETAPAPAVHLENAPAVESAPPSAQASAPAPAGDAQRRRRRRRRGRRGTMAPSESNNAPAATAILAAGVIADGEEDDDAEAEESPESGEPAAQELSAQPVLSEPAGTVPTPLSPEPPPAVAPWSPEPQPAPEPATAQPEREHSAQRFELSGEVTGPPAASEPAPAAPGVPGAPPGSGTPDQ